MCYNIYTEGRKVVNMEIIDKRVKRDMRDLKLGDVLVSKENEYYMVIEDLDGLYEEEIIFDYLLVDLEYGCIDAVDFNYLKDFKIVKAKLHIE